MKFVNLKQNHLSEDANDYLKSLFTEQDNFETGVDFLKSQISETKKQSSDSDDLISKIKVLEDGILSQENQIFLTSTKMIPSITLSDSCGNITELEKE